jgi:hypothetical protein
MRTKFSPVSARGCGSIEQGPLHSQFKQLNPKIYGLLVFPFHAYDVLALALAYIR